MSITKTLFGTTARGEAVYAYTLESPEGLNAQVLDYGCILRRVRVPDREGRLVPVCQGLAALAEYEAGDSYLGAIIGRCAGRIGGGRLSLNGRRYTLACNQAPNHLHGGGRGFDRYVWAARIAEEKLVLSRLSPDGEEGYPGNLRATVSYAWRGAALCLELEASADADTPVSLTHHGYWNLSGADGRDVGKNCFQTPAERFAAIDGDGLPTGALLPTAGGAFDFRAPAPLCRGWDAPDPQIAAGHGYDHTFLVPGCGLRRAGELYAADSGVVMTVSATLPGLHLYSGNFLTPRPRAAAALEAQFIPDAVHHPDFPAVILHPGETWRHEIVYDFGVR